MTVRDDQLSNTGGGRLKIPRSRGAMSGFLLILLGLWGALIPFIGPYFNFAYSPDDEWVWSSARGWLEVLPGAVTALGGLLLLMSGNRLVAAFGSWLAAAGGAWFVVGTPLATLLSIGSPGQPVASGDGKHALLELTYFYGLGAVILFLASTALGRLSVRSVRDVRSAHDHELQRLPADDLGTGSDSIPVHADPGVAPVQQRRGFPHRGGGAAGPSWS